ncbi:MAG: hypothetical protein U0599_27085 [Vicinamibacteria bacterium]
MRARIGAHERDEVQEHGARAGGDELERRLPIGDGAREREGHLLPAAAAGLQPHLGELAPVLAHDAQAERRRPSLGTEPQRAVVALSRLDVEPALAYAGRAAPRGEPHAVLSPLEHRGDERRLAALAEGRPVVGEVLPFEALPADLLGVEPVDDRVVDLLEELAVEAFVDLSRDAIGVDQQHGHSGFGGAGRPREKATGQPRGQAGGGQRPKGIGPRAGRQAHGAKSTVTVRRANPRVGFAVQDLTPAVPLE